MNFKGTHFIKWDAQASHYVVLVVILLLKFIFLNTLHLDCKEKAVKFTEVLNRKIRNALNPPTPCVLFNATFFPRRSCWINLRYSQYKL